MDAIKIAIREMEPSERHLLRDFLYEAIHLPEGMAPPSKSVVDLPELRVYVEEFGTWPGDHCLVADANGQVVGAVWSRIMDDYGHIDNATPSLAISLVPECRGKGIGTRLMSAMISLLREKEFSQVSLSVQTENPAASLYQRFGFRIVERKGTEYIMVRELSAPVNASEASRPLSGGQ